MSDYATHVTQIEENQEGKEETANENFNGLSPALAFARMLSSVGLTWAYYGLARWYVNVTALPKANTTIALTASSTRYLAADRALVVTQVATAFPPELLALYKVTTGTSTVSGYEDHRDIHHTVRFLYGRTTIAMADANVTLTYAQAMCESLEFTGSNTALRDCIVPKVIRRWSVFANTTTNGVRVIAATGTGITIAVNKTADVEWDGTNVRRLTADV